MIRLAIDTSSPVSSVALDCGADGLFVRELASRDTHSQTLQRAVDELLEDSPLDSLSAVQSIGIGLGPGSFTGIRIGLSFAKGLSWSWRVPLTGVSTFEAMAHSQIRSGKSVAVSSDARRNEFFFSAWQNRNGALVCVEPLRIAGAEEISRIISSNGAAGDWVLIDAGNDSSPCENIETLAASHVAAGILAIMPEPAPWSIERLTAIEPLYIRAVAALTIQERINLGMLPPN